jgi:hypothetical protein
MKDTTFVIKNIGGGILSGTVTESCNHYFVPGGSASYALAAGESTTVTVVFNPAASDTHICTVETGNDLCDNVSCTGWSYWPAGGFISLYADQQGTVCQLTDVPFALTAVYVIHTPHPYGARGCSFRVVPGGGADLTYFSESSPFGMVVGNSQIGVSIAYTDGPDPPTCLHSPVHVLTIYYFGTGNSPPCSYLEVVDPQGYDCAYEWWTRGASWLYINPDGSCECGAVTSVTKPLVPEMFALHQNSPNPFRLATTIRYELAESSPVRLEVFDLHGRRVSMLENTPNREPGQYERDWDGRDDSGRPVAVGIYFYRLQAGPFSATRKLVLIR